MIEAKDPYTTSDKDLEALCALPPHARLKYGKPEDIDDVITGILLAYGKVLQSRDHRVDIITIAQAKAEILALIKYMKRRADNMNGEDTKNENSELTEEELKSALGSHALAKACYDEFDYALRLRTGEVIRFRFATYLGDGWVHLDLEGCEQSDHYPLAFSKLARGVDRGVDVRLSDIVWVMDAPEGS